VLLRPLRARPRRRAAGAHSRRRRGSGDAPPPWPVARRGRGAGTPGRGAEGGGSGIGWRPTRRRRTCSRRPLLLLAVREDERTERFLWTCLCLEWWNEGRGAASGGQEEEEEQGWGVSYDWSIQKSRAPFLRASLSQHTRRRQPRSSLRTITTPSSSHPSHPIGRVHPAEPAASARSVQLSLFRRTPRASLSLSRARALAPLPRAPYLCLERAP